MLGNQTCWCCTELPNCMKPAWTNKIFYDIWSNFIQHSQTWSNKVSKWKKVLSPNKLCLISLATDTFSFLKPVKGSYYASLVLLFDWLVIVHCSNVFLPFRLNLVTLLRMSKQRSKTRKVKHCLVLQISLCLCSNSQTKDFENFKTVTVLHEMPYGDDLICGRSCLNCASGKK